MRTKIIIAVAVVALCGVAFLYKDMIMNLVGYTSSSDSEFVDLDPSVQGQDSANQESLPNTNDMQNVPVAQNNDICSESNPNNCFLNAKKYMENKDISKALGVLIQGCEYKDSESCFMLANMYDDNNTSLKSEYIYLGYILKACDLNNMEACYHLGVKYYRGDSLVKRDIKKSFDLFKAVCDSGRMEGCNNLAVIYNNGDGGIKKDLNRAKELFTNACKVGYKPSCDNIDKIFK